jgi:ribonuclease HI
MVFRFMVSQVLCGRASNLSIELSTIWRGLHLTWDLGRRSVILESDSKKAMDFDYRRSRH